MQAFNQKKASILQEIGGNSSDSPDASPKGTIDSLCLPIIEVINSHPDMVTTSSCSGRVSVFLEGIKKESQIGAKGNEGRWLFVTHHPEDLPQWHKKLDLKYEEPQSMEDSQRYILFKFEPLILHVKCRDLATSNLLYSTAMGCGFRESGIGSNNIVGIRTSIKLDVPIGCLDGEQLVSFVSESYLELITKLSLDRFTENFKKMDTLKNAITSMGQAKVPDAKETKEERRIRKMKEGMARRDGVREEKEKKKREKELLQSQEQKQEKS
ncbi:hypothetical protein FT663_04047 [Candidozyma haemuli var. vulneris]|uniref:tRNA wybutosine-synthesizing protein 3 n=1 Tax=Candidozyma haemuli TaxID=45357 RepID=A0A2V1AN64_9ASCO|nr:hypothetical protein CXQ85_003356 [[Candida] haemuloni]KAF3987226.1 hypothetical protein FT662_04128 [[Candida] haemuloni var. vulneris]KAF3988435.1 hypothetical protein FT663_04047 [[Candida] haemuloni var. vulneris]PVH19510.1 hypothetical protein CXQ85_003356 [[Candida] haemuloni]